MKKFVVKSKHIRNIIAREIIRLGSHENDIYAKVKHFDGSRFDFDYTRSLIGIVRQKRKLLMARQDRLKIMHQIKSGGRSSDWWLAFPTLPMALFIGLPTFGLSMVVWAWNARRKKLISHLREELSDVDKDIKRIKQTLHDNGGRFV